MNQNVQNALEQLANSVLDLFRDANLKYANPGEPHVVTELFVHLKPRFPNYNVSNEYDRREDEIKKLGNSKIIPDLIVHRVGNQDFNLLVVEVKLHKNTKYKSDIKKLSGMTERYGGYRYAVGVHLVLNIPESYIVHGNVYIDGEINQELTHWFETYIYGDS